MTRVELMISWIFGQQCGASTIFLSQSHSWLSHELLSKLLGSWPRSCSCPKWTRLACPFRRVSVDLGVFDTIRSGLFWPWVRSAKAQRALLLAAPSNVRTLRCAKVLMALSLNTSSKRKLNSIYYTALLSRQVKLNGEQHGQWEKKSRWKAQYTGMRIERNNHTMNIKEKTN